MNYNNDYFAKNKDYRSYKKQVKARLTVRTFKVVKK